MSLPPVLVPASLGEEAIIALVLAERLDHIERLDRMILQAEARRDAMLAQFERRRVAGRDRLTRGSRDVVDADYPDVGRATQAAWAAGARALPSVETSPSTHAE